MAAGRPDFWYGQVLLFEENPADGATDRGPTSNWAYDHLHTGVHIANQPSSADADLAAHEADTSTHGVDEVDGVDERNAAIATHAGSAAAHHAKYTDAEALAAVLPTYVSRGDSSAYDLDDSAMTLDGSWAYWNLSAIVPTNAKAVKILCKLDATAAGNEILFKENGYSNDYNIGHAQALVAGLDCFVELIVSITTDRLLRYQGTAAEWNDADFLIAGYWI